MTFPGHPGARRHQAQVQTAFDAWREAKLEVHLRWGVFLVADRASRPGAFADYIAALDAETAAAGDLARTQSNLTEAA